MKRLAIAAVATLLGSAPLAVLLTLLATPFWSWVEATFEFEAIGHSGPAEWCYLVTYVASVVAVATAGALRQGARR